MRGQSLTEYSVFVAVILIAIMFMTIYVKRGVQARHKAEMDAAWAQVTKKAIEDNPALAKVGLEKNSQYEPYYSKVSNKVGMSRGASKTIGEVNTTGKVINPGKVAKTLSGGPTTVTNTSSELAGAKDDVLERGTVITEVK